MQGCNEIFLSTKGGGVGSSSSGEKNFSVHGVNHERRSFIQTFDRETVAEQFLFSTDCRALCASVHLLN